MSEIAAFFFHTIIRIVLRFARNIKSNACLFFVSSVFIRIFGNLLLII